MLRQVGDVVPAIPQGTGEAVNITELAISDDDPF